MKKNEIRIRIRKGRITVIENPNDLAILINDYDWKGTRPIGDIMQDTRGCYIERKLQKEGIMPSMKKEGFFGMLRRGNVIGFEEEACEDIITYLDENLDENIIFEEHNYRVGEGFENLIDFESFEKILTTSKIQEVKGKESDEVEARRYYEYKVLEKNGSVAILVAGVVVVNTPDVEPFYEVEAKLYVFYNV